MNSVRLVLHDVYSGGEGGQVPDGDPLVDGDDYVNPCPLPEPGTADNGCVLAAECASNADTVVEFNLTLLRQAELGFLDSVVRFSDIFCAAKLDCETDTGGDLLYLHDVDASADGPTAVLGFTCSSGSGEPVEMYMDDLVIACGTGGGESFSVTRTATVDPGAGPGNLGEQAVVDPDGILFGAAVHSGPAFHGARYWNVLLGMNLPAAVGETCTLTARATASESALTLDGDVYALPPAARYPYLTWDVALSDSGGRVCGRHPVNGSGGAAGVGTAYSDPSHPVTFAHRLSLGAVAASCGSLGPCPQGFTCTDSATCESPSTHEVWVPAGTFWQGCNDAVDPSCSAEPIWFGDSVPRRHVSLSAFAIDRTSVTAAEYEACVAAAVCAYTGSTTHADRTYEVAGKEDHPINFVSWDEAIAYCEWQGKTLCTEAQWERAARGGCETVEGDCQSGMRTYPWGNSTPVGCDEANWVDCSSATPGWPGGPGPTTEVGVFPGGVSPYGALDMAGNVVEWVRDYAAAYTSDPVVDPEATTPDSWRARRGGSYGLNAGFQRAVARFFAPPHTQDATVGFRCCRPTSAP